MEFALWSAIVGLLLVSMALSDSLLARLPLSTSMLYLAAGAAVSPLWLNLAAPSPVNDSRLLEHAAEVAVLLSLFTSGLSRNFPRADARATSGEGLVSHALAAAGTSWKPRV